MMNGLPERILLLIVRSSAQFVFPPASCSRRGVLKMHGSSCLYPGARGRLCPLSLSSGLWMRNGVFNENIIVHCCVMVLACKGRLLLDDRFCFCSRAVHKVHAFTPERKPSRCVQYSPPIRVQ